MLIKIKKIKVELLLSPDTVFIDVELNDAAVTDMCDMMGTDAVCMEIGREIMNWRLNAALDIR